ncbi:hypothetical protein GF402_11785 [Candidatus Fermentibacteria bacterium]|nr:hypothetical protein [Candidatus Fermentibacteria bacterium]
MAGELDLFSTAEPQRVSVLFLDTETTGSDPESADICELAMLLMPYMGTGRAPDEPKQLHTLVKPPAAIPPEASAVHHITDEMVDGAPAVSELREKVAELFSDADYVCAHNLPFDLTVISRVMPAIVREVADNSRLDSLRLARHVWPDIPSHSLQALRYRFGLDRGLEGDAHRAMFDTLLARALVERALQALPEIGRWDELVEYANSPLDVQVFHFGKYRGNLVEDVIVRDIDYVRWLLQQDWLSKEYPDLGHTLLRKTSGKDKDGD